MKDRGMVSREHTLRLSDHDGKMIANKNDHLVMLILRKRRAMATMIITQCLKSYEIMHMIRMDILPSILLSCVRNLSCAGCSAREVMLMSTKATSMVGIQLFMKQHIMAGWST